MATGAHERRWRGQGTPQDVVKKKKYSTGHDQRRPTVVVISIQN